LTEEHNHHVSIGAHHTKFNGFEGWSDNVARKLLSEYAYKNFFLVSLKRSSRLQHRDLEDGAVVVWPSNATNPLLAEEEKRLIIPPGMRCPCVRQRMHLIQCEHEFNATKIVEKEKCNDRWYNPEAYCQEVMDLTAHSFFVLGDTNQHSLILLAGPNNEERQGVNALEAVDNDGGSDTNGNETYFPQDDDDLEDDKENEIQHLSYSAVVGKCTADLVKTIQNDPAEMTKLFVLMENMVKRYCGGCTVEVDMRTSAPLASESQPVLTSITCPVRNATSMKRKKSARKSVQGKRHRKTLTASQFSQADDDDMLPAPKTKTRSCRLCRCGGHGQFVCGELTKYGSPLKKGS
jgi:hypothetical protein